MHDCINVCVSCNGIPVNICVCMCVCVCVNMCVKMDETIYAYQVSENVGGVLSLHCPKF